MKTYPLGILATLMALGTFALVGCGGNGGGTHSAGETHGEGHDHHEHGESGPHGGSVLELGEHEYHLEWMLDEATGTATIHVLDADLKKPVPIELDQIRVNVRHGGKADQLLLDAQPETGEAEGSSSRFVGASDDLTGWLHEDGAAAEIVLTIAGRSFRAAMAGHDDHDHGDAHDHDAHDH